MNGITSAPTENQALTFNEWQLGEAEHARTGQLDSEKKAWRHRIWPSACPGDDTWCCPSSNIPHYPPETLLVQNPTPEAALVPASTHRAQAGAPACSDPPPTFNLMKTNVGDNYP